MKINLSVDVDELMCGECPFKDWSMIEMHGTCLLFKERLISMRRYGSVEGFHRCESCKTVFVAAEKSILEKPKRRRLK